MRLFRGLLLIVVLLFFGIVSLEVNAQNQFSAAIQQRLKQQGVPVKEVVIIHRLPYEIEIALQSSSNDSLLSVEDNWYMQLARREATFLYRTNTRLSSYGLTVYNAKNEMIYSTQTYLHPQDLDQQAVMVTPRIDNATARDIVAGQLQLGGLSLDNLEVNPDTATGSSGQILILNVSAENLAAANASLPNFLGSLFRILDTVNAHYGTYLVLCHLRVLDGQENILLDYVKDLESGSTQWTSVEGLYSEWFSVPAGPKNVSPASTPTIPQQPYPAPLNLDETNPSDAYP